MLYSLRNLLAKTNAEYLRVLSKQNKSKAEAELDAAYLNWLGEKRLKYKAEYDKTKADKEKLLAKIKAYKASNRD